MNKDIDDLKREHDKDVELEASFHTNPIKRVIQSLFHDEFHDTEYHKYSLQEAKSLVADKINNSGASGVHKAAGSRLLKRVNKATSIEDLLLKLNEYLFS